jgi:outer membrane protein insertion porin family
LTIPVDEGAKYSWAGAEWSGNQVLPVKELDDALAMKAGEVANGKTFDKGLSEVRQAYSKHGYIQVSIDPTPEFDEAAAKVSFKIAVNEGPQYHMGAVDFKGFSADDAFILGKRWGLRSGEVYDRSYADRFLKENAGEMMMRIGRERQAQGKPLPNLGIQEKPDREGLTVNLTIELKG